MLMAEEAELSPWIKALDEKALHVVGAGYATSAGRAASARARLSHVARAAAPTSFATLA